MVSKEMLLSKSLATIGIEGIVQVPIEKINPFEKHPFKIIADDNMDELIRSIQTHGIITPVLIRPYNNMFEMISGHRRLYAAKELGLDSIPAIIRSMDDDEAAIEVVNANLQRSVWLPSEKAFAYRMKIEALRHQGERRDLTCGHFDHKLKGKKARDIVAEESMVSSRTVQRHVRLTYLIPEIIELVDKKKMGIACAEEVSYLDHDVQEMVYNHVMDNKPIKIDQVKRLRDCGGLEKEDIIKIMNDSSSNTIKHASIVLNAVELNKFFSKDLSDEKRMETIWWLISGWSNGEIEKKIQRCKYEFI